MSAILALETLYFPLLPLILLTENIIVNMPSYYAEGDFVYSVYVFFYPLEWICRLPQLYISVHVRTIYVADYTERRSFEQSPRQASIHKCQHHLVPDR
jgi:hypothetical protein